MPHLPVLPPLAVTAALLAAVPAHAARNGSLVVSRDVDANGRSQLATLSPSGRLHALTSAEDRAVGGGASYVGGPEAFRDGRTLLVYTNRARSGLATLDVRNGRLRQVPNPLELSYDPLSPPVGVSLAPDGRSYLAPTFVGDLVRGSLDGRATTLLAGDEAGVRHVTVSPDGKLLALETSSPSGLFLYDRASLEPIRRLAKRGSEVSFSPDGRRLVFSTNFTRGTGSYEGGDLHVVRRDGTGERTLVRRRRVAATQPTWSPDGKRIAYVQLGSGRGDTHYRVDASVWTVPAAGGKATRLVELAQPKVEEDAFHVPELAWLRAR